MKGLPDKIVAFLLGELSADECKQIEDGFENDALFHEILAVEDELFDAYAAGSLTGPRRLRFEQKLLRTRAQRQKLAFSRTLLGYHRRHAWAASLQLVPRLVWVLGALLLIAAPAAWWFSRSHPHIAQRASLPSAAPAPAPAPVVAVFVLIPGQTRNLETTRPFTIPPGASSIEFDAVLEADVYPAYHAALRTIDGDEIWSAGGLRAVDISAGRAVQARIPAKLLASRDYFLRIDGVTATGELRSAAEYSVTFAR